MRGGQLGNTRILSEASIKTMTTNQIGELVVTLQPAEIPAVAQPFPIGAGRDKFGFGFRITAVEEPPPNSRSASSVSWGDLQHALLDRSDTRHFRSTSYADSPLLRPTVYRGSHGPRDAREPIPAIFDSQMGVCRGRGEEKATGITRFNRWLERLEHVRFMRTVTTGQRNAASVGCRRSYAAVCDVVPNAFCYNPSMNATLMPPIFSA